MSKSIETIGLKNISIDFLNNEIQHLFAVQGDTKTRGLLVRIKDNNGNTIPASTEYELRLYAKYTDEAKLLYSVADIVDEQYRVYLTTDMLRKVGTLIIQLALYKDNVELIQSKQSSLQVHPSMTCQIDLGEDKVIDIIKMQESLDGFEEKLDKLKNFDEFDGLDSLTDFKKSETTRQEAETKRVQAEEQRVVEETNRVSNEQSRVENEKQRVADEEVRVDNEKTRVANEQARQEAETVRNNKLESLSTLETERKELLETWKNEEASRVQHESTREENEKIRKISETVRDDNETKRKLEEDTRVQQENARVEAEKTRKSDEQVRSQSEKTRQEQEETRQRQEEERTKAEQQRSTKDTERDVTFKNWDIKIKSLSGLPDKLPEMPKIEKATETTAGVVKLKGLSEEDDTAVSYSLYNKSITDISSNVDNKLNEKEQAFSGKIEEQNTQLSVHDKSIKLLETKTDSLSSQVTGLSTSVDEKISKQNTDINSKLEQQNTTVADKLSEQDSKVDTKLKEYNANIEKNTTGISDINNKLLEQDKTIQNQDTKINAINEKLSTNDTDIKGLKDTTQNLTNKAEKIVGELDTKAIKEHTHTTADITDLQIKLDEKAEKKYVDYEIRRATSPLDWTEEKVDELTNAIRYLTEWRNFEFLPANIQKSEKLTLKYEGKDKNKIFTLKKGDNKLHYTELDDFNKNIDFLLLRFSNREWEFVNDFRSILLKLYGFENFGKDNISAIEKLGLRLAKCREVKRKDADGYTEYTFETEYIDELEIKEEGYTKANKNHTHKIADIEGLQGTLDEKASADSVAEVKEQANENKNFITKIFLQLDDKVSKTEISDLQKDILVGYLTSKDVDIQKIAFTNKGIGKAIYRYLELTNQTENVDRSELESCESLIEILKNVELLEKLPSTILTSEATMNFIVNSSKAMKIISDNSLAMNSIVNSDTAMNIIIFSDMAMSLIINNNTAMNSIVNSGKAMSYIVSNRTITDKMAKKALDNAEFATNFYEQVKKNNIYKLISSKNADDTGLQNKFNNISPRQFVIANLGAYSDSSACKHKLTLFNGNTLEKEFKGRGSLSNGANFIMFSEQKHGYDGDDYDGYALYELVE